MNIQIQWEMVTAIAVILAFFGYIIDLRIAVHLSKFWKDIRKEFVTVDQCKLLQQQSVCRMFRREDSSQDSEQEG